MATVTPLTPEALCQLCDPEQFNFETTAELEDLKDVIGQDRAVEAIKFGIGIRQEGYNLFALGPHGTGKFTSVSRSLGQKAAAEAIPSDWCYVYNFEQPHMPTALTLPHGQGEQLHQDMKQLVEELFAVIPSAFEDDEYINRKRTIDSEFQERQESAIEAIREDAEKKNIALIRTPSGLAFAPLRDSEVIKPEEFLALPEEQRKEIETQIEHLQRNLQDVLRQVPQWIREGRARVKALNEEVATFAITPLFEEIRVGYSDQEDVLAYLDAALKDIIQHNDQFIPSEEEHGEAPAGPTGIPSEHPQGSIAIRYQVNVIINHGLSDGAPVVYEQNPTYPNLIGRLEHFAQMGALLTDFTLIKAGALHRANGGYLIIDARKLLANPYAWEGLKRALRSGEITIEAPGQAYGLVTTIGLQPQPIPLDVKIVLLGDRMLYYMMHQHDPDFSELFKVAADFDDQMDRNLDNNLTYAHLISTLVRKEDLRHFNRPGVARLIEYSARLVGDGEKLSAHMQSVADMLREANYWAGESGSEVVDSDHVLQAIQAQVYRSSRLRERLQEAILRDTVLIDTQDSKIGQINGLSVMMLGNYAFGRPSRITARVRMGKGEVIDIERQVELGGPLHSKGVLILSSYLGSRYVPDQPLSLSASLVFEQSYGGVDGDSASSAELYALLSALSRVPIQQSFAVTGSVNQHGQVQAIGGVNEKIEGFFDICSARGLTGDQGVLVPIANVKNLMLRQDVVDAVTEGIFAIYPITTIEEGIEVLTGVPAGELGEDGSYPESTINQLVTKQLESMAETQRTFYRPMEG
jgi:lon-related putative ATP-dependent protease